MQLSENINFKEKRQALSITGIICFIWLAFPIYSSTFMQYISLLACGIAISLFHKITRIRLASTVDIIPAVFLFVWMLGVINGLLRDNGISNVLNNFVGMPFYLLYYLITAQKKLTAEIVSRIVIFASIIASVENLVAFHLYRSGHSVFWPISNIRFNPETCSIVMSGICVLPLTLVAWSLWCIMHKSGRHRIWAIFLLGLSTISCLYTTDSGGARVAFIAVAFFVIALSPCTNRDNAWYWIASVSFLLLVIAFGLSYELRTGAVSSIFSSTTSGNSKRMYQFTMVGNRIKWFGNGLGALFDAYLSEQSNTYGIEVSYLNLVDKFGVLSLPLFWSYAYTIVKEAISIIKIKELQEYGVIAIGLLAYLFVALGNPVLFSPYNVTLHILSLFLLRQMESISRTA